MLGKLRPAAPLAIADGGWPPERPLGEAFEAADELLGAPPGLAEEEPSGSSRLLLEGFAGAPEGGDIDPRAARSGAGRMLGSPGGGDPGGRFDPAFGGDPDASEPVAAPDAGCDAPDVAPAQPTPPVGGFEPVDPPEPVDEGESLPAPASWGTPFVVSDGDVTVSLAPGVAADRPPNDVVTSRPVPAAAGFPVAAGFPAG
jgi:hypothetical protein